MKTCKKGHEKTPENTYPSGGCKACERERRKANPEYNRERNRKWRKANPEKARGYQREYCKKNPEKARDQRRRANKKQVSTLPGYMKRAALYAHHRSKKKNIVFDISAQDLVDIFNEQNGLCAISGMPLDWQTFGKGRSPLTCSIDRINPKVGYIRSNLRLVCMQINTMKTDLTDKELRKWCLRAIEGLKGSAPNTLIANFNTLADVADRLAVEISKVAHFENKKREAHKAGDTGSIVEWDNRSRDACEYRSMLRNEFNAILSEIVRTGQYQTLPELRTFSKPPKSVAELLDDMYYKTSNDVLKGKLAKAIEKELNNVLK